MCEFSDYIAGTSSVARGLSGYLDALLGSPMQRFFREWMPINVSFLAEYPDFLSFVIILLIAVLLAVGVKESTFLNNIFTVVNLCTVAIVIVTGIMRGNINLGIALRALQAWLGIRHYYHCCCKALFITFHHTAGVCGNDEFLAMPGWVIDIPFCSSDFDKKSIRLIATS